MKRTVFVLLVAPVLGVLAVLLPALLWPPAKSYDSPLFPLLRTAMEGAGAGQLGLFFVVGVLLGLLSPLRAWLLGATSVLLLPLATFAEIIEDPTSHSLFPFELVLHAFFAVVVTLGVLAVRRVRPPPHSSGAADR